MDYSHRKIESLTELKPGDHIVVEESRANLLGRKKTHHLLVVKAIDHTHVDVIHSVSDNTDGVVDERKRYSPRHVTVLDYETRFTGSAIIERAWDMQRSSKPVSLGDGSAWRNSEDFVTEARTGIEKSFFSLFNFGQIFRQLVGWGAPSDGSGRRRAGKI